MKEYINQSLSFTCYIFFLKKKTKNWRKVYTKYKKLVFSLLIFITSYKIILRYGQNLGTIA